MNSLKDKKKKVLAELNEPDQATEFMETMSQLDRYTVTPPSPQATEKLIAFLKPMIEEQPCMQQNLLEQESDFAQPESIWRLLAPQTMLLSKKFVILSLLLFVIGIWISGRLSGDTLKFLANASPILGLFTVLYEFRARSSKVDEFEAACPYSPAQLATARLIVILAYDIALCLLAMLVVGWGPSQLFGRAVLSWFAPLLFMLGIALAASLKFGVLGGCLISAAVWALQLGIGRGEFILQILLPQQNALLVDGLGVLAGAILLLVAQQNWQSYFEKVGDRHD